MGDWKTTSGNFEDFTMALCRARFADPGFAGGPSFGGQPPVHLYLAGPTDSSEHPHWELSFSCGRGWRIEDDGRCVVGKGRFHEKSGVGLVLKAMSEMSALVAVLNRRGDPQEAASWLGLKLQFAPKAINYGGEIGERTVILPIGFCGEVDPARCGFDPGRVESRFSRRNSGGDDDGFAFGANAPLPVASPTVAELMPASLRASLTDLALQAGNPRTFGEKALLVPRVVANERLLAMALDEGPAGLFAELTKVIPF